MAHLPLVSIIVPNYNHAPYLEQRLESIYTQTYQEYEVILLDDCSSDNSFSLLERYASHPKTKCLIRNEKNSGTPFKQWVKGLEMASGTYIWIAESDDFAATYFLEKTVSYFSNEPKLQLVYTDSTIVDEKGNSIGVWSTEKNKYFQTDRWNHDYINNGIDEFVHFLIYRTTINNASAVVFKRETVLNGGFQNELQKFRNVGDLFTYSVLCLNGKIGYHSEALNFYREHSQNLTAANKQSGLLYRERLECFATIFQLISPKALEENNSRELLQKGCLFVLHKNLFMLLKFHDYETLEKYLVSSKRLGLLGPFQVFFLSSLIRLYKIPLPLSKKIINRILKKYFLGKSLQHTNQN